MISSSTHPTITMVCFDQISHTNLQNLISYKVMVHLSILKILHMLLHSTVYKWTLFIKNRPNLIKFVMQCKDLSLDFFLFSYWLAVPQL